MKRRFVWALQFRDGRFFPLTGVPELHDRKCDAEMMAHDYELTDKNEKWFVRPVKVEIVRVKKGG